MKKPKPKKCRNCKEFFDPYKSTAIACSLGCAIELTNKANAKKWRKEKAERKEKLKTNQDHVRELQVVFNKWIRLRDKDKGCISCGKPLAGKFDAGHFYSTGSYPELRFHLMNVHGQCVYCNQHKRGNIHEYRKGLISRRGEAVIKALDKLKGTPRKYTTIELIEMKKLYKELIKQL